MFFHPDFYKSGIYTPVQLPISNISLYLQKLNHKVLTQYSSFTTFKISLSPSIPQAIRFYHRHTRSILSVLCLCLLLSSHSYTVEIEDVNIMLYHIYCYSLEYRIKTTFLSLAQRVYLNKDNSTSNQLSIDSP